MQGAVSVPQPGDRCAHEDGQHDGAPQPQPGASKGGRDAFICAFISLNPSRPSRRAGRSSSVKPNSATIARCSGLPMNGSSALFHACSNRRSSLRNAKPPDPQSVFPIRPLCEKGCAASVFPCTGPAASHFTLGEDRAKPSANPVSTATRPVRASGTTTSRLSVMPTSLSRDSSTACARTAIFTSSRAAA